MNIVKARIQGNATVVTIPKSFNVKPGTKFRFEQGKDGSLILKPTKKVPASMQELFKDWHGKYQVADDLKDWDQIKPEGEELW
jgi:antitoxin component of MazEF toxin-antitoxin module